MKKLIVGIPTSFILMMSSCTATLQEFQDRNNDDDNNVEEVSDEQTDVEGLEDNDSSDAESENDGETDDEETSEDPDTTEVDEDSESDETEPDEEEPVDENDEDTKDNETEQVTVGMDDLPEEVIQEFMRLNERTETLENRLNTLERHLNEAEDEISRLYDSLGNRVTPREGEEETESNGRDEIEVLDTSDGRGSRSEPFDVGDTVAIEVFEYASGFNRMFGTAEITIDDVVTGDDAFDALIEESRFNSEAPDGYEWAIISMTFYLADFENDDISIGVTDSLSIVSVSGSTPPNEYALPPSPLTYTEVFSGGEVKGNMAKLVPIDESFLIYFDSFKAEDLFFLYDRDENYENNRDEDTDAEEETDTEEGTDTEEETEDTDSEEDSE